MSSYKGNETISQKQLFSPAIVELRDEELESVVGGHSEHRNHSDHDDYGWRRHHRWHHDHDHDWHHHYHHHWW